MKDQSELFDSVGSVILTEDKINGLVQNSRLIDKTTFDPTSLETCSYDIRVGNLGVVGGSGKELDLNTEVLELPPGGYAGLISWEEFVFPKDICFRLGSKRSYSYDGVILLSGTLVDPGYQGYLLFGVYNASQKKYLLRKGAKICNAVFERLPGEVDRDGAQDAYLIRGKFPHDFIDKTANMEVLPWMQISERVKQIERMSAEIVDLRTRYDDVMVPIEKLTENVNFISQDVAKLSDQTAALRTAAGENAKQVHEVISRFSEINTKLNVSIQTAERAESKGKEHCTIINDMRVKLGRFSFAVYVFFALGLVALGSLLPRIIDTVINALSGP